MMGGKEPRPVREYVETGAEPEYFVTETRYEAMANGNVRRFAYVLRNGELHLIHTEVIPARALIVMGRKAQQVGTEAFNLSQWQEDATEH